MPNDPLDRQLWADPDDAFSYDVFISYSPKDILWVRDSLMEQLEAYGVRVCIDFRDFQPGAPFVDEIERAILTSRYTLVVLTPDFMTSSWTHFEEVLSFTISESLRQRRVIPILKTMCDRPLRIRSLIDVNFTDPDMHEFAYKRLLERIDRTNSHKPVSQIQRHIIPEHKLFKLLLNIDFLEQISLVRRTIERHTIASFLIQGDAEFGLDSLV